MSDFAKKAFFDTFSNSRLSKILKILSEKSLISEIFKISLSLEFEKRSNNGLFSLKIVKILLSLEFEKVSRKAFCEKI